MVHVLEILVVILLCCWIVPYAIGAICIAAMAILAVLIGGWMSIEALWKTFWR
jgi:hypothetical protein